MFSGGIDSTLVVISLLKNATEEQKKRLVILLSEDSIIENTKFYEEFILGKLTVEPSLNFPYLLGKKDQIIVIGEHNDQVFGSDIIGVYMRKNSDSEAFSDYTRENIVDFFNTINNNLEMNNYLFDHFDRLCKNAPVKIKTVYDFIQKDRHWIKENLSKPHETIWYELNGESVLDIDSEKKTLYGSIQKTRSFHPFTNDKVFLLSQLSKHIEDSCNKARYYDLVSKEVYIFLKTKDFYLV
jgi:hypothetical protein